jgi:hypothetical protein
MGIYVSGKPQEYKILAKLEKQTRFAVKDTRLGKNDRGILVQFLVETRHIFLLSNYQTGPGAHKPRIRYQRRRKVKLTTPLHIVLRLQLHKPVCFPNLVL